MATSITFAFENFGIISKVFISTLRRVEHPILERAKRNNGKVISICSNLFFSMDFSDLNGKFPQDYITKIGNVIELQQWIINTTDSNIEEVITKIKNSIFLESKNIPILVDSLISIAASRYDLNEILVSIIIKLFEQEINQSIKDKIKNKLAKYPFKTQFRSYQFALFLRKLYDNKIIPIPFKEKIDQPYREYLFPELCRDIPYKSKFFSNILFIGKNCFPKGSPMIAVKEDNIDALMEFASQPSFDVNTPISRYSDYFALTFEIDYSTGRNITLIDIAAMFGSVRCFKYLQVLGAKITSITANIAVWGGSLEIIRILDSNGEDLHHSIEFAISSFRNDVFDWLLDTKCDATIEAICSAAKYGNYYALMKLYSKEVKNTNQTALQMAIFNNHYLMIEALISASDYDCNLPNQNMTIFNAIKTGSLKKVRMIHKKGTSLKHQLFRNKSVLTLAIQSKSLKVLKYLIEETDATPEAHECPFLNAIEKADLEIIKYFATSKFFNIREQTKDGMNALHVAVNTNVPEIVEFIVSLGVDSKHEDSNKNTPYAYAVINNLKRSCAVLESHDEVYKEMTSSQLRSMATNLLNPPIRLQYEFEPDKHFKRIENRIKEYGGNPAEILKGVELHQGEIRETIRDWLSVLGLEILSQDNSHIIVSK